MFCVLKVEVRAEGDQHDFLSTNWNSTPHRPAEHDKVMTKIDQEYSRTVSFSTPLINQGYFATRNCSCMNIMNIFLPI